ncbi:MAG: FtsK/SpoIIIE domain-containing protein [bacterium]|nr:FtsK/SpoIIIE domain-containing protein [bacterium]
MTLAVNAGGFSAEPPEPLEFFIRPYTHPDNLDLLDSLERFRPLGPLDRLKKRRQLRALHIQLRRAQYNRWVLHRDQLLTAWQECKSEVIERRGRLESLDDEQRLMERRRIGALIRRGRELARRGRRADERLAELANLHNAYLRIKDHLDHDAAHHAELVGRERKDRKIRREMRQENKWIRDLLIEAFRTTKTPLCHYWAKDRNGNEYAVTPYFRRPYGITADSHWFRLATSAKGFFGLGYRSLLPYGVNPSDLCSDVVIEKMSVLTGRQVEVVYAPSGAIWFKVNRLDSPDGLPIKVTWRDVMPYFPTAQADKIPFCLGVIANRKLKWMNFEDEDPHLLIGGSSKSGKSNLMNAIIACAATAMSPKRLRIVFIDGKGGIEFIHWADIPHRYGDVGKTIDGVLPILRDLVKVMDARSENLARFKMKNLDEFNARVNEDEKLPKLLVVIDELNRFIKQKEKTEEFHHLLTLLCSLGRAAGIHVIAATQHAIADVVPTTIKTNMMRISGAMPTSDASRVILDRGEAADLPRIRGRMLFGSGMELVQFQAPYIANEDIAEIVRISQNRYGVPEPLKELGADAPSVSIKLWDVTETIQFVLDRLDGQLSAAKISASIGGEPNEYHFKKVIARISDEVERQGFIMHKGVGYRVKPIRKAKYLIAVEAAEPAPGGDEVKSIEQETEPA